MYAEPLCYIEQLSEWTCPYKVPVYLKSDTLLACAQLWVNITVPFVCLQL